MTYKVSANTKLEVFCNISEATTFEVYFLSSDEKKQHVISVFEKYTTEGILPYLQITESGKLIVKGTFRSSNGLIQGAIYGCPHFGYEFLWDVSMVRTADGPTSNNPKSIKQECEILIN